MLSFYMPMTLSKEWIYTLLVLGLGIGSWVWNYKKAANKYSRPPSKLDVPTKRLWTRQEIADSFTPTSWQRQAFEAFSARILLQDPQVFPCIYATKGFKANEHRFCFINNLSSGIGTTIRISTLDALAASFDEYAGSWRSYGPMTSLVVLTPLPPPCPPADYESCNNWPSGTLLDDRQLFWDLLRGLTDRDPCSWPERIPESASAPAWTLAFRGERFVGLALTPRYQKRQSRFCDGFALAFQPLGIFQDLLSTPEKMACAVGKVRALTDSLDSVPYSQDVIAVAEGKQSVSTMFFLSDEDEFWGSVYDKIRSG